MQRPRLKYLQNRDGLWHYVRRVPISVIALDDRGLVKETTKTRVADDPSGIRASEAAEVIDGKLEAFRMGLVQGRAVEAKALPPRQTRPRGSSCSASVAQ